METAKNPARTDPGVRAAMKELQLARLAAKAQVAAGTMDTATYSALYAKQPGQIARRQQQAAERAQRRELQRAANAAALEAATASSAVFKGEDE